MKINKIILMLGVAIGAIFLSKQTEAFHSTTNIEYSNIIPTEIKVNILHDDGIPNYMNYVFVRTADAPVRTFPDVNSIELIRIPFNSKMKVFEKVSDAQGNKWYRVKLKGNDGSENFGYVSENLVIFREFKFLEMSNRIKNLEKFLKDESDRGKELVSINTYKPNPSNSNMDRTQDKYGTSADQNAKADFNGETIYIPDRSLVSIEKISGDDVYVNALSIAEKELKISKRDITRYPKINKDFRKVIAIDLKNENQGIFQKNDLGEWELISYTLNKTGAESTLGFETPKGYFIVPTLKFEMAYRDEYNNAGGIAKYAIRFSGGGYIHGTPIAHEENINRDFFLKEKDGTLGTYEGTRKCIRNIESHIKFLFEWATNGKINRKSNNQRPDENVMVVVF